MELFPAIDILGGCAVRLFQGDYEKQEVFGKDPLLFAKLFEAEGAKFLHVVDLDGAKDGRMVNFEIVKNICENTSMTVELGGGIRDMKCVEDCISAGVDRVILGTAALSDPEFLEQALAKYGDKIAVGVDAKNGFVATDGWKKTSQQDSVEFCKYLAQLGVKYIIYTDISKDGAMQGTNLEIYKELTKIQGVNFTASGGVSSLSDIRELKEIGVYAAILGRSLYSGAIELKEALSSAF